MKKVSLFLTSITVFVSSVVIANPLQLGPMRRPLFSSSISPNQEITIVFDQEKQSTGQSPISFWQTMTFGFNTKTIVDVGQTVLETDVSPTETQYKVTGIPKRAVVAGIEKGSESGVHILKIRKEDVDQEISVFPEDILTSAELGPLADPDYVFVATRFQEYNFIVILNDAEPGQSPLVRGTRFLAKLFVHLSGKRGLPIVGRNRFSGTIDSRSGYPLEVAKKTKEHLQKMGVKSPTRADWLKAQILVEHELVKKEKNPKQKTLAEIVAIKDSMSEYLGAGKYQPPKSGVRIKLSAKATKEMSLGKGESGSKDMIENGMQSIFGEFSPYQTNDLAIALGFPASRPTNNPKDWKMGINANYEKSFEGLSLNNLARTFDLPLTPANRAKIKTIIAETFKESASEE